MGKILLHICCGVCASSVVQRLREEGFEVVGFFYNPNIHPQEEYVKREGIAKQVATILGFELIPAPYDKDNWFAIVKGLEDEPEGGRRCCACFKMRLEESAKMAEQLGIQKFTTTLTVSPHKDALVINNIGEGISPSGFVVGDFKKQDVRLRPQQEDYGRTSSDYPPKPYHRSKNLQAKADGFQLAMEFAKRYNLYRQNYCGCIYSVRKEGSQKC